MKMSKLDFGTPNPVQARALEAFREGKRIVLMSGGRQIGKALGLDTPIPTPQGFTRMGEIRVGDTVFGSNGEPVKVVGATDVMHNHEVYEVQFSTGEVVVADADHQWFTISKSERKRGKIGKVRTTREISERVMVGKEYNHYVPQTFPVMLPHRELPLSPYVLGVWLGDGTCGQPHVTIGSKADLTIPRVESEGFSLRRLYSSPYRYSVGERGNKYHPCDLTVALKELGVYYEKSIPQEYLRASLSQRRALYDGLMGTDGHVNKKDYAEITFRDKALIEGMRELVASLGFKPGPITHRPEVNAYRLTWLTRAVRPRAVVRVTPIPSVPVRCIEVDAFDHMFLVGEGFIPTHNSHLGARWLITQTMKPNDKFKLAAAVAPTYRMARVLQRKIEEVLKEDPSLWKKITHRKQPIPTYQFPNGWLIEVHSSDDPDALRGPTFSAVWYDEVAKGSKESFDIIMPTLLASKGSFLGTTTPRGKQNWIYNQIYLKSCPPGHPDHTPESYNPAYATITGSTWDNAENLSIEAVQQLEDQYGVGSIFGRQEVAGEFVSYEGLVYEWDEANYIPVSQVPPMEDFAQVIGGIDFGWTDPAAAYVLGYKDGVWYVVDGVYESRLEPNDFALAIGELGDRYKVRVWYADSARPDAIADLNSRGLPVLPVIKPRIEDRIREMAMFTDNYRFKVSHRAPDVRNELQTYQYPDETRLQRDRLRNPVDKNNHALDAIGYAVWSVRWLWRNDASYRIKGDRVEKDDDDEKAFIRVNSKRRGSSSTPAGLYGS